MDIEVAREMRKVVMREQQLNRTGMHGVGNVGTPGGGGTPGGKAGVRRTAGDLGGL